MILSPTMCELLAWLCVIFQWVFGVKVLYVRLFKYWLTTLGVCLTEVFVTTVRIPPKLAFCLFCPGSPTFPMGVIKISIFTARCTLVQSAVLRLHVVCLSVCPSVRPSVCDVGELWSHRLEFFKNNFTVS